MVPMSLPPASSSSPSSGPGGAGAGLSDPPAVGTRPGVLTRLDLRGREADVRDRLPAPALGGDGLAESTQAVRAILDRVRRDGDLAVRELTRQFDGVAIDDLRVPDAEVTAALAAIPPELRTAMQVAHDNIVTYHRTQLHDDTRLDRDGLVVRDLTIPVDRAGLYVPGGRAPLASTVLMTAGPARVAGVNGLALCSPPGPDGRLPAPILAAAAIAGVDEVYRVGGAQAIAALAYGTESVPAVDVIVGPGNRYVAIAERLVAGDGLVGVPSAFTGPSEVVVVADASTPVSYAAVDLVVQAEHGPDGLAYLITWSEAAAAAISEEVARITDASPGGPRSWPPSNGVASQCWSTGPNRPWPWPMSSPPSISSCSTTIPSPSYR